MDFAIQDFISSLLRSIKVDQITEGCLTIIVVTFIVYTYMQYRHADTDYRGTGSTTLTSLGIAGTFIGILMGLQDFDFTNLQQGITVLLEGLKTAFYTSVTGLGCAILFQTIAAPTAQRLGKANSLEKSGDDLTPGDFFDVIKELQINQQQQSESMSQLVRVMGGDGDSSLVTQMKLSRQEFNDFRTDLKSDMQNFAEMLSKSATETIIQALKDVISDFNKNLTEQFGENFKRLNDAVFELVKWQDNYKYQLEVMQERFDQSIQVSRSLVTSTESVAENLKSIPESMEALEEIMEGLNEQIDELDRHLEAFVEMKNEAVQSIPQIQSHVTDLVNQISAASKESSELSEQSISQAKDLIRDHGTAGSEIIEQYKEAGLQGAKHLEEAVQKSAEGISKDLEEVQSSFTGMTKTFTEESSNLMDLFGQEMTRTRESATEHQVEMQRVFAESISKVNESHQDLLRQAKTTSDNLLSSVEQLTKDTSDRIRTSVDLSFSELDNKTKGYFGSLDENLKEVAAKHQSLLDGAMKDLAGVINSEVNEVVRQMGEGLKRISEALVSDIGNLRSLTEEILKQKDNRKDD